MPDVFESPQKPLLCVCAEDNVGGAPTTYNLYSMICCWYATHITHATYPTTASVGLRAKVLSAFKAIVNKRGSYFFLRNLSHRIGIHPL